MGIIEERKSQRITIISNIKKAIDAARAKDKKPLMRYLLAEVQTTYHVSARTAREYVTQALYELELDKDFNKISVQEKLL